MNLLNKLINYLLIILFFFLPLVNSHFFDLIGIKAGFYVNGNYEFTKVIFFNILSGIIICLFFLKKLFENILKVKKIKFLYIPKIIYLFFLIIISSSLFSNYFYTSLLGNSSKSHSAIMFINLILIFIILINNSKKLLKNLLKTTIISSIFVSIIGIKEYLLPSFNYGDLQNRAFSTFGHPNYFALFILILLPFLFGHFNLIKNKKINTFLIHLLQVLLIFTIFITKSVWGIFIFISYLGYELIIKYRKILNKTIIIPSIFLITILFVLYFYEFGLITKLHSFLSRFFIWQTTLNIIFSDIKNIIFGSGLGTLEYVFDKFKSPYLYIFENIGFTADRTHNLILSFFYNFGLFGLFLIIYLIYKIIFYYKITKHKYKMYYESLFLFFIFTIFNFASISHYLIIILIGSYILINTKKVNQKNNFYKNIFILFSTIITIFGIYFSSIYYINENKIYSNSLYISKNIFYNKLKSENYKINMFGEKFTNIQNMCQGLITYSASVENYFYCGNLLWKIDNNLSINYYNKGLNKLPDLRNINSKYNKQFLINNFVDKKRFFSTKYSNLEEILKKTGKR